MIRKRLFLDRNLLIIFSITLTAILSVSSLTPAFPWIIKELGISTQSIGLLITVFTLPGIILTPVLGVFADQYGRKKILIPSLLLFGIAGGACGLVRDFEMLLLLRFIQGIGAASLGSLNFTLIGDLFSGKERTAAMGYNSSVLSIGTASYPAIGGLLAAIAWNYPFFLALLGIPVGFLVLFGLNNPEPKNKSNLKDYLRNLWISLNNRKVALLFAANLVTFIILYGSYLTFFSLMVSNKFETTPKEIGLIMSSMSIFTALTSSQLGRLSAKFGEKLLIRISFVMFAIALSIMPSIDRLWMYVFPLMIYGIGMGFNVPCVISMITALAPLEYRAGVMSAGGMVLRMGQTLGPLIIGLAFTIGGINLTFFTGMSFGIIMFLVLTLFLD
jgi:MFS family permease